jgi:amino acid transporter
VQGISFFGFTGVGQTTAEGNPAGVLAGSAIVFFAYIGFDSVSCQAEETERPERDLPIGILLSLGVSTLLYVLTALVLTGMVPYDQINVDAPLSDAFGQRGWVWCEAVIAVGAVVGMISVLTMNLMGQPRILMAMARDGLLPPFFAHVHPKYGTPIKSTVLTGVLVAGVASVIPLSILVELVSIGTLLAFTVVCVSVLVLHYKSPHLPRKFRTPGMPFVPAIGAFICFMLVCRRAHAVGPLRSLLPVLMCCAVWLRCACLCADAVAAVPELAAFVGVVGGGAHHILFVWSTSLEAARAAVRSRAADGRTAGRKRRRRRRRRRTHCRRATGLIGGCGRSGGR